ncbi:TPA: hypothetical protein ACKROV_002470 [Providencia alcalifaciens]
MIKNINPRSESIININDNKIITTSSLSNKIKKTNNIGSCIPDNNRLSNLHYQKKHFAISTCYFEPSEQKEINLIKYSPPVEKITLPYKYHEAIKVSDHFLILRQPHIFEHSISIQNKPFISKQKDTDMTSINNASDQKINVFKDFKLNRSSSLFSNLILEIKSTNEKGIRYLKNVFQREKNETHCIVFKNGEISITDKAKIARQVLAKQHDIKQTSTILNDLTYTYQQEKSDFYNNYKFLLGEINLIEGKINKIIMENAKLSGKSSGPYKYYNQFKNINFIDLIDSPKSSDDRIKSIQVILSQMTSTVRMLEHEYSSFQSVNDNKFKTEQLNNAESVKKASLSSNDSLNSDSSGYKSDISRLSNETQQLFASQRKPPVKLLPRREEMGPNEQSSIESKKNSAPQRNISLAIPQVSSRYSSLNKSLNQKKKDIDDLLNSFNSDEKPSLTKGNIKSNKDNLGSSTSHTYTRIAAEKKSTAKTKVTNRKIVGLEQTQAEKMARLTRGHSTTGYIHPSRRAQPNNAEKEQKIKQFDEQISKLLAMRAEAQAMLDTTTKEEKAVNQLIIETKNDVAALKHKLKA